MHLHTSIPFQLHIYPTAQILYAYRAHGDSMLELVRTTLTYSDFLYQSVKRDINNKYRRSALGYVWSMLHPLLMMLILTLVFSTMMQRDVEHYPVFLFSAMLPWTFFSTTLQGSLRSISRNAKIFGQIPVPKYLFILSLTFSNLYSFAITLVPFIAITLLVGHPLSWTLLLTPLCLLPLLATTIGAALLAATLNVFFEDIEHLTTVLIRGLYFLCPIIYPASMLSEKTRIILEYNPLFALITLFRDVLYFGKLPSSYLLGITSLTSLVILSLGYWIFQRAERKMIYFV